MNATGSTRSQQVVAYDDLSFRHILPRLCKFIKRRRRFQLFAMLGVMALSSFSEVLSLAAVIPFLAVLTEPEQLWQQPTLRAVAEMLGIINPRDMLLPITICFTTAVVIAASMRLVNLWLNGRLAAAISSDLCQNAYHRTLYQPYSFHTTKNSCNVIAQMAQVDGVTTLLDHGLQFISNSLLMASIILVLFVIDPWLSLTVLIIFGGSYGFVAWIVKQRLKKNGVHIATCMRGRLKSLHEGLGAIRDVILDASQAVYVDLYRRNDRPLRLRNAQNQFLSGFPRFLMEAIGIILIAWIALVLVQQNGNLNSAIPILGSLALGAQRLLPTLQRLYSSWAIIRGQSAAVRDALQLLEQPLPKAAMMHSPPPLNPQASIRFDKVSFRYNPESPFVLQDISLTIERGERVGFVGPTGSGKSTAIDLMMGLLEPTEGQILIDGQAITGKDNELRRLAWRRAIGHVPQTIFLADISIAENIAFGIPSDQIDHERVRAAAQQAQIAGYIEGLCDGYSTFVGERGIRLSGGQRQRIGIARALYKQVSMLIFDEATSALDNGTEEAVMQAIEEASQNLTCVLIAHRLATVANCDKVIVLEDGHLEAQGHYDELCYTNPTFRRMTQPKAA